MGWKYQLNRLFEEFSKEELLNALAANPEEVSLLIQIIESPPEKTAWRAAWIIDHFNQQYPELISPYLPELLRILKETAYNGARRSLLKIMISHPTMHSEDGELLDRCFHWTCSPSVPIAVRAHAMQYIHKLLPVYPELKNEFQICLESAVHDESKGVKGKAGKLLEKLIKRE